MGLTTEDIIEILLSQYTLEDLHVSRFLLTDLEYGIEDFVSHYRGEILEMLSEDGHCG